MSHAPLLSATSRNRPADPVRDAARRLRDALPQGEDATVLVDFIEDDLREGFASIAELEAHFVSMVEALSTSRPSPISLLESSDEVRALQRLETLNGLVNQLHRRISLAASRLRAR